jgi:predicted acyl esterase
MRIIFPILTSLMLISCSGNDKIDPRKTELKIPLRDGTLLATDVYLPRGKGKYPVVLVRTPYGKWQDAWMGKAFRFFRIGVVLQDVRGRNLNNGEPAATAVTMKAAGQKVYFGAETPSSINLPIFEN